MSALRGTGLQAAALLIVWTAAIGTARAMESGDLMIAEILHFSRSSVYIDKGEVDGLTPDSELAVYREGRKIGDMRVSYLARHSASCRVVTAEGSFEHGDEVRYMAVELTPVAKEPTGPTLRVEDVSAKPLVLPLRDVGPHLDGRCALEWGAFDDAGDTGGDYQRPSVYLRLNSRRLFHRPLELRVRLRIEELRRSREVGSELPLTERLYRFYRLSLTYDDSRKPFRVAAGRLFSYDLRAAGSWDGVLLEYRACKRWRIGVLGGGEPEITSGKPEFERRQWGGYATYTAGTRGRTRYQGTVGVVGRYDGGGVSREFAVVTNEFSAGRRLRVRQDLELDVNREWRKEAAGSDQTLSRFNVLLERQFTERFHGHVGYDYFRNVRRSDTRDIPDSLFFDPLLQGMRLGAGYTLSPSWTVHARVGVRDQSNEEKRPVYGNARVGWRDALGSGANLQLRYAYADGRIAQSHAPSLDVRRQFGSALRLGLGVGARTYEGQDRRSFTAEGQRVRFYGTYLLTRRIDFQWLYSLASGDIAPGSRIVLRLGSRL